MIPKIGSPQSVENTLTYSRSRFAKVGGAGGGGVNGDFQCTKAMNVDGRKCVRITFNSN